MVQKPLIKVFDERLSHKVFLSDVMPYIESLWIIWNGIKYQPFYFLLFQSINQSIFLYFESPLWKVGVLLLKNNYTSIFIMKFLMYNQFQFFNLISFIIHYWCPKKRHSIKMGFVTQKVSHLSVHSPR
jgi:hypothetical protein